MRGALVLVAVAAGFGAFWSAFSSCWINSERQADAIVINPAAQIESLFSKQCGISLASFFVAIAAAMLRGALHLGRLCWVVPNSVCGPENNAT